MEKELLKKLVEINSYFDEKKGESENSLAIYLESFFRKNFLEYKIQKIKVAKNRNNLLIIPKNPHVIFCCHMDTVLPSKQKHTKIKIEGDKIYGLGTKDMKGGTVSAILSALESNSGNRNKIGFLFYCDEEYTQKGMETMLINKNRIPKSVKSFISPESRFNLAYGCRGYATINLKVFGKKSHTSRPHYGINAGEIFFRGYEDLKTRFKREKSSLGISVIILTSLRVGTQINGKFAEQKSSVPDYAEGSVAIRLAKTYSMQSVHELITAVFSKYITKDKFSLKIEELRQPSSITEKKDLNKFLLSAKEAGFHIELADPALAGYNDVAMLSSALKLPFFGFGPYGEGNHGPDEWVSMQSIIDTKEVFKNFISKL